MFPRAVPTQVRRRVPSCHFCSFFCRVVSRFRRVLSFPEMRLKIGAILLYRMLSFLTKGFPFPPTRTAGPLSDNEIRRVFVYTWPATVLLAIIRSKFLFFICVFDVSLRQSPYDKDSVILDVFPRRQCRDDGRRKRRR